MKKAKLRIFRFDPDKDLLPSYREYDVPCEGFMTVQMALKYIYENIDNTLAFRDYCCGSMKCYGCIVKVNGKPARACSTVVLPGQKITVDPIEVHAIIRDLVVAFKNKVASPSFKDLYREIVKAGKCTACNACVNACPYNLIQIFDDKPVISALVNQDYCPVGDTIECGKCAFACPEYQLKEKGI